MPCNDFRLFPPDPHIVNNGITVCIVMGSPLAIERWVQNIAQKTSTRLDWYFNNNQQALVIHLGDDVSLHNVLTEIKASMYKLEVDVLHIAPLV
jgi:hypothetical protein